MVGTSLWLQPSKHTACSPHHYLHKLAPHIPKLLVMRWVLGAMEPGVVPWGALGTKIQSEVSNNKGETQVCHQKVYTEHGAQGQKEACCLLRMDRPLVIRQRPNLPKT